MSTKETDKAPELGWFDTPPVELDPPAPLPPEVSRWQQLAARDIRIRHDGDAEKVIPFPRPAWADPDEDNVGRSLSGSCYRSSYVRVPVTNAKGTNNDGVLDPAEVTVSARIHGDGLKVVGLKTLRYDATEEEWDLGSIGMSAASAVELAKVLLAAAELLRNTDVP